MTIYTLKSDKTIDSVSSLLRRGLARKILSQIFFSKSGRPDRVIVNLTRLN